MSPFQLCPRSNTPSPTAYDTHIMDFPHGLSRENLLFFLGRGDILILGILFGRPQGAD